MSTALNKTVCPYEVTEITFGFGKMYKKHKREDESKDQRIQMQIYSTSDQRIRANKTITVHQPKIIVRGRSVLKLTA